MVFAGSTYHAKRELDDVIIGRLSAARHSYCLAKGGYAKSYGGTAALVPLE